MPPAPNTVISRHCLLCTPPELITAALLLCWVQSALLPDFCAFFGGRALGIVLYGLLEQVPLPACHYSLPSSQVPAGESLASLGICGGLSRDLALDLDYRYVLPSGPGRAASTPAPSSSVPTFLMCSLAPGCTTAVSLGPLFRAKTLLQVSVWGGLFNTGFLGDFFSSLIFTLIATIVCKSIYFLPSFFHFFLKSLFLYHNGFVTIKRFAHRKAWEHVFGGQLPSWPYK